AHSSWAPDVNSNPGTNSSATAPSLHTRARNKWSLQPVGNSRIPAEVREMSDWKFDPLHTQVEFSAKHLGMMTVRGHFAEPTATGNVNPQHPSQQHFEATINTASIRTHNEIRDNDLRSSN